MKRRALSGVASVLCAAACLNRSPTLEPGIPATLFVRDVPLDTELIEVRDRGDVSARELATLRPCDELARLDRLPVAVIQSTQDSYLPAARARQLFGPDGERRRFHSIRSGNHTFAGARDSLYEQARVALEWIVASGPGGAPAQTRPTP